MKLGNLFVLAQSIAFVAWIGVVSSALAEQPDPKRIPTDGRGQLTQGQDAQKRPFGAQHINDMLDAIGNFEAVNMPLAKALQKIADAEQINIVIDERGLQDVGMTCHDVVTIEYHDGTLRAALQTVLNARGLAFTVENQVLNITSKEKIDQRLRIHAYDVTHLLKNGVTSENVARMISDQSIPQEAARAQALENFVILALNDSEHRRLHKILDSLSPDIIQQWTRDQARPAVIPPAAP